MRTTRRLLAASLALTTVALPALLASEGSSAAASGLPPVGHVWTVMLENSDFATTFAGGKATNPYIATELAAKGVLIPNYFGIGHNSLDNYLAQISGQAPNVPTKADCQDASVLGGAAGVTFDADGQAIGADGCTYPASVTTLVDQFDEAGVSWKGYMEDVDATPGTKRNTCQYAGSVPKAGQDLTTKKPFDNYARKHDPFVYFHSITDRLDYCDAHDVAEPQLVTDLQSIETTPQFSYITPNLCNDAHDATCSDGGSGGLKRADEWAMTYIPKILASPAFKKDGLLILTVDEGTVPLSCCNEPKGPNLPLTVDNGTFGNGSGGTPGRGGGQIGTVMISPFITAGATDTTGMYNHYSYLRSMEDLFHIGATAAIPGSDKLGHLGYAGTNDGNAPVTPFGDDIFTNKAGTPTASATPTATATATPTPPAPRLTSVSPRTLTAGTKVVVRATGTPGQVLDLLDRRSPDTTYTLIRRSTAAADGTVTWPDVTPATNSVLQVQQHETGRTSGTVALTVRANLHLSASRTSARHWTFSGSAFPHRSQTVTLSEVRKDGHLTRLGSARAAGDGSLRIAHTFPTSGRRTFVLTTPAGSTNAAGTSARLTVTIT